MAKNEAKIALRSFSEEGPWPPQRVAPLFYAYILRSEQNPDVLYHGSTADLKKRLQAHNLGRNRSTIAMRPWQLAWYAGFQSETAAKNFERYLKTSSGKAFARKRLLSP